MLSPTVLAVIDEVEQYVEGKDDAWNIPRDEGLILHTLIRLGQCRTLVEIGTSYGFSGLFLASAAQANGGLLHTYEIDARKCDIAAGYFAKAGLAAAVQIHCGDARKELPKLDRPVDFAFIDAAKPQTMEYWQVLEPLLAKRCMVTLDNITDSAEELRGFVQMLQSRPDFVACDVTVGNGFELAVRAQ